MYFYEDNKSVTKSIDSLAVNVVKYMTEQGVTLSAAESCTGGLLSSCITEVPGASEIFAGGAVVYTEEMKMRLLGVSEDTLRRFTVYSEEVAHEMSTGVRKLTGSDYAIGITGIAGPGGGTRDKPVGTVYVSVCGQDAETVKNLALYNEIEYEKLDRRRIRELTVLRALEMLSDMLSKR